MSDYIQIVQELMRENVQLRKKLEDMTRIRPGVCRCIQTLKDQLCFLKMKIAEQDIDRKEMAEMLNVLLQHDKGKAALQDEIAELRAKLSFIDAELNCVVCMEKRRSVVISCGHLVCCPDCYVKIRYAENSCGASCPICVKPLSDEDFHIIVS